MLNTWRPDNVPVTVDGDGGYSSVSFEFGDETEVDYSCSVIFGNQFLMYGGKKFPDQISRINGCRIERVGTLGFDHTRGGCAVDNKGQIFLCFDLTTTKTCRMSTDPLRDFQPIADSNETHQSTQIASSEGFSNFSI